jgi:hypothetical protein
VSAYLKRWLPFALVTAVSAWIASRSVGTGDYPADAGPAIDALAHGHIADFLGADPVMGPVSILLRAPFALLGGGNELDAYRWGSFPCLLAVGLLGLYLAGLARRRGAGSLAQAAIATACLFNPLTFVALDNGHPEEILTAALAVGAVAVAAEGHSRRAALLLGLAIASKQWAVIAILPVLMALPSGRLRAGLAAAAIVVALSAPSLVAEPDTFAGSQGNVAFGSRLVGPWSAWYPTATVTTATVERPDGDLTVHAHHVSSLVGRFAHPAIVLLALALPLALAARRRRFGLSGADAMALLALLALLRCALDPVDNLYYHVPLLLALAGWDAFASRGLPVRVLTGVAVAELFSRWAVKLSDPFALNAIYLIVAGAAGVAIALALLRQPSRQAAGEPRPAPAATPAVLLGR